MRKVCNPERLLFLFKLPPDQIYENNDDIAAGADSALLVFCDKKLRIVTNLYGEELLLKSSNVKPFLLN